MINTTKNEFQKKASEIDEYFTHLESLQGLGEQSEIYKILKANSFLMLYNIIESTIRSIIADIHDDINLSNIRYDECHHGIKAIWIEYNYKKFKEKKAISIAEIINNISNDIFSVDFTEYVKIKDDLSGSLDAQKIRQLASKYNFQPNRLVRGRRLLRIKNNRNALAHGEVSFAEIGRNFDYPELNKFKRECILYLKEVLIIIERYLIEKTYKV